MKIETLILYHLCNTDNYMRKVIPFIKDEYFGDITEKRIFQTISKFVQTYNKTPTVTAISVELDKLSLSQLEYDNLQKYLNELKVLTSNENLEWLLEQTEKFCKDRAVYNALYECIQIIDDKYTEQKTSKNAIPEILKSALSVSFDRSIGHEYLEQLEKRYEFYHKDVEKIPYDIDILNKITKGGTPKKTLNIISAGSNKGKSIFLCHHAANCLRQNRNVLYVTLEMSEEQIAKRIDANIMDITLDDLDNLTLSDYEKRFKRKTDTIKGKLIIKEYPTTCASTADIRALIEELKMKRKFELDVLCLDYLNLCASARYKANAATNSYTLVKSICEELRGLAMEKNIQIFTATQLNREGMGSTDIDMTHISESIGAGFTCDFMLGMTVTDQLAEMNQVLFKQLKNRNNDVNYYNKFVVGLNKAKMKFYDLEDKAQESLISKDSAKPKKSLKDFEGFGDKEKLPNTTQDWL